MTGTSHILNCYGYLVTMVTKRSSNKSFVLSPIEFIFDVVP